MLYIHVCQEAYCAARPLTFLRKLAAVTSQFITKWPRTLSSS